mmetsp:Transcript_115587/g.331845  ORF Transcript_115587/g.331845 Transcript_115587/m.331845 type:complete len:240 (+) Transcript_115587:725-1444(+)
MGHHVFPGHGRFFTYRWRSLCGVDRSVRCEFPAEGCRGGFRHVDVGPHPHGEPGGPPCLIRECRAGLHGSPCLARISGALGRSTRRPKGRGLGLCRRLCRFHHHGRHGALGLRDRSAPTLQPRLPPAPSRRRQVLVWIPSSIACGLPRHRHFPAEQPHELLRPPSARQQRESGAEGFRGLRRCLATSALRRLRYIGRPRHRENLCRLFWALVDAFLALRSAHSGQAHHPGGFRQFPASV